MKTNMKSNLKAFQGANGWYIAEVDADGSHHQPGNGSRMHGTQGAAWREYLEQHADEAEAAPKPGQNYKDR